MAVYEFETYDVFTEEKFAGNQLAVLLNAEGLTDLQMQAIAREFNLSETTFVLPPHDVSNTARVRIFTPVYEMPFAGHPTVGTAIAIARNRQVSDEVNLELNAGLFPVALDFSGPRAFAAFLNPNLPQEMSDTPTPEALEAVLSLPQGAIDREACRPRRITAGAPYVYAYASLADVHRARLNMSAFDEMNFEDTVGVYLYASGGEEDNTDYHARMFAPNAGVPEDPATGSAAAALPGHLALSDMLGDGEHRLVIEQGYEMGRPSRIYADVTQHAGSVYSVKIGGFAVPVQKGEIEV